MTTAILLYTAVDKTKLGKALKKVGFEKSTKVPDHYTNQNIDDLILSISEGDKTIIEFGDKSNRFPDNPGAIEVLKELYVKVPDLECSEYNFPPNLAPEGPLSLYLDSLNQ